MLEQFLNHIREKRLCQTSDRVLVAVSGGLDSMVLLHLFVRSGIPVGVAHVNFGLRTEATDEEEHVRQTCLAQNIPFFVRHCDTRQFAETHKLSIQLAARNLRYDFFREVAENEGYNWVATAHHANDNFETVLLNLVRGTGIDGLAGIPLRQGKVIRPLLFATRADILEWARENDIRWMEDLSNQEDYYQRNFIRNQVISRLRELNPSLENSFTRTLARIQGTRDLALHVVRAVRKETVHEANDSITIRRDGLDVTEYPAVLLWEISKEWGFSFDQCSDIMGTRQSGKQFFSATHQLTVDRNAFIIVPITPTLFSEVVISASDTTVCGPWSSLRLESFPNTDFALNRNPEIANIDFDRLTFPLIWRKWREGDAFTPLGMNHQKKVSDFLIDRKVPRPQKHRVTVLESAGTIVWVVGFRIAEPFKITPSTSRILVIREVSAGNDFG